MDKDDLIKVLQVENSNLKFEENKLGLSFPCCICEHGDKPPGNEICDDCDHAW
jgi:hypothetical protein